MAESQIGIYSRAPRRGTRPPTANLTRSRSLLEDGGFRPALHP